MALLGQVRLAGRGWFRSGKPGSGLAGLVGYGMVGSCTVCLGLAGEVRQCEFGIGLVMQVKVRFSVAGMVRRCGVRCGSVLSGRHG